MGFFLFLGGSDCRRRDCHEDGCEPSAALGSPATVPQQSGTRASQREVCDDGVPKAVKDGLKSHLQLASFRLYAAVLKGVLQMVTNPQDMFLQTECILEIENPFVGDCAVSFEVKLIGRRMP